MQEDKPYGYSVADIERYLSGKMQAQEMHELERAALSDPMLADAIDGFRLASASQTDQHLNAIHAAILGNTIQTATHKPAGRSRSLGWRWAAAACLLGLLATGAWWLNRSQTASPDLAQMSSPQPPAAGKTALEPDQSEPTAADSIYTQAPVKASASELQTKKKLTGPTESIAKAKPALPQPPSPSQPTVTIPSGQIPLAKRRVMATRAAAPASNQGAPMEEKSFQYQIAPNYINGRVTDEQGKPVPAATIVAAQKPGQPIQSKKDGSFAFPATDSQSVVSITSPGYARSVATLKAEKANHIALTRRTGQADEVLVVGAKKQRKREGVLRDYNQFRKEAIAAQKNMILYPEEGWANFYQGLAGNLGVDSSRATKTLQIKFTVDEDGEPTNFSIVETPDEITAKKAIEYIKKAKWKNFKLNKTATVRIPVN